ncbi:C-GCAxxG-C-C family (seleno)protein [Clostridium sporogenes]|uniref:C-GCAxxG-C-C family (seleno)protein n=1 Tax=Clostridium sporogenes TaxID=1509 RepID=UPI002900226E|nr:C-GCAxxG-C-C family (seleno)protein [Clostridium botulinum]
MSRVVEIHKEGFNCAESIIKALNEEKNLNIPVAIASPFGGGMTVGSTCGAITGALMALGAIKGREECKSKNQSIAFAKEVMSKVKEKYDTFDCRELKKKGISCDEMIEFAYEVVKKYI